VVAALVGHFDTVSAAIAASHPAMEAGAAAVELVDRIILNLARRSPIHRHLASSSTAIPGRCSGSSSTATRPAEAAAGVERLRERWAREGHGYALVTAKTPPNRRAFRSCGRPGQGLLLAAGENGERSLAFVEDTAVPPERLAEYAERFAALLDRHG
jgi:FAD/FMN-containing dehydrogenase